MQRLSILFRSGLLVLAIFGAGVSAIFAQPYDATSGVPVRVWGAAFGKKTTGTAQVQLMGDFLATSGSGTTTLTLNGTTASTTDVWFQTDDGTAHMEPGKIYHITVSGAFAGGVATAVALNAAPPLGYEIEIDSIPRQRAENGTSDNHIYQVRLLGLKERAFMEAGSTTQLMIGRIYWQLGLGGLRNGKAAGSIAIVDAGASSSWSALYTPSALQYEAPSDEIVVLRASGNVLRQVIANQAVVDIVTVSSTAYDIGLYHPAQASGSGTTVRTFTGNPYLKYRVEQGATSTTLKITSETRNTTAANSWTASVVRTAVTTLARTGSSWPNYTWTRSDWNTSGQTQLAEQVTTSSAPSTANVEILVVGGGGGGGATSGGGGGGGGVVANSSYAVSLATNVTVTVGGGGSGGSGQANGANGGNSVFGSITAYGGGGGGGQNYSGPPHDGSTGGSGGGGGGSTVYPVDYVGPVDNGGSSVSGQGNGGGDSYADGTYPQGPEAAGGGGGGAGSAGANGNTPNEGGNGGNGVSSSISGSSITYAGGGGGSSNGGSSGNGGTGGGGAGDRKSVV
jgi:hypothetical protein